MYLELVFSPQVQKPAPEFKADAVVAGTTKQIALSDYKGKYVVLFFYPLDWTFVCPTEIIAFSDAAAKFQQIDCELIGCNVDSVFSHLQWVNTERKKGGLGGCNFPLLSDLSHKIAKDYDILIEVSVRNPSLVCTVFLYGAFTILQDGGDAGIALRGLFIIDDKGNLRSSIINDLPVGRNPDEVLRLVQAFQFTGMYRPGSPYFSQTIIALDLTVTFGLKCPL